MYITVITIYEKKCSKNFVAPFENRVQKSYTILIFTIHPKKKWNLTKKEMWQSSITSHMLKETDFDKGVRLLQGFNREECAAYFEAFLNITTIPYERAFAHWAISYCHGSDYNMYATVYEKIRESDQWPSLRSARHHISECLNLNAPKNEDWSFIYDATYLRFEKLDLELYVAHLDEHEFKYTEAMIFAVNAEAHMLLEPWKLWNRKSMMPTENAKLVCDILNKGLTSFPMDEWLCHLKVHYCEMGPKEQFDMKAANVLKSSIHGHLRHMPSHLLIQTGEYADSRDINKDAVEIDRRDRLVKRSTLSIYAFYECHNMHFVVFASCMCGDYENALYYSKLLTDFVYTRLSENNQISTSMCEAFLMIEIMVYVRFGKWKVLMNLSDSDGRSEFDNTYTLFVAYGKTIAAAALGLLGEAKMHRVEFLRLRALLTTFKMLHNESVSKICDLAAVVSDAEIKYRENGAISKEWIALLQEGIRLEDSLAYDEPPSWMIPVRQTLGALLIEVKLIDEGKYYLREDLRNWTQNVWSSAALRETGEQIDISIFSAATVIIKTSCACAMESSCCCDD